MSLGSAVYLQTCITTVGGQSAYPLNLAFQHLYGSYLIDKGVRSLMQGVRSLMQVTYDDFKKLDQSLVGEPRVIWVDGTGVRVWPTPSSAQNIILHILGSATASPFPISAEWRAAYDREMEKRRC